MYNSLSELHEGLDKKVLPKEYGGEMPMTEMIGKYIINFIMKQIFWLVNFIFLSLMEKRITGQQKSDICFRQYEVTN